MLAVNLTDFDNFKFKIERACIVKAGEHPDITKDSAANFIPKNPRELPQNKLEEILSNSPASGVRHLQDLKPSVLERLRAGARDSAEMDPQLKRKYGLI